MSSQINPRLRRTDVMLNSIASYIANTSKKLSRTPEMSFPKMLPQPCMLPQKFIRCNTLKQLECFSNTHGERHFKEKVDMIDSDMQFVDAKFVFFSNFTDKPFTINPYAIELHRTSSISGFLNEMESILSEDVFKTSQVHFFTPKKLKFDKFNPEEIMSESFIFNQQTKLNRGMAIPLPVFKAEVSLP